MLNDEAIDNTNTYQASNCFFHKVKNVFNKLHNRVFKLRIRIYKIRILTCQNWKIRIRKKRHQQMNLALHSGRIF